ncbi:MAG: cytochrome c oxidase subunit II [Pseudomonadota bacterium]|nr:cytochrome c oxidase subunit II [Pseudomonadota bacterium]|tara:strand:+ start:1709 stop:2986 length:1278 start_codon:yes stop_codon:yes gene_type:complete
MDMLFRTKSAFSQIKPTWHIKKVASQFFTACLGFSLSSLALAEQLNLREGVTEISKEVYSLHQYMLTICTVIAIVVFSIMFYSIVKHRKSKGHKPANFHESTAVEILWTVIPFIILIAMAFPATKTLIAMTDTDASALTIKATGHQWKWEYEYLQYEDDANLKLNFFSNLSTPEEEFKTPSRDTGLFPTPWGSDPATDQAVIDAPTKNENYLLEVDNPVYVPTGQKVRILTTSADVIHSWFLPDAAVKKDAIPGFTNETWFEIPEGKEGIYRGQCTELCGAYHGFMPIEVHAVSQEDFKQWLADAQAEQEARELAAADETNIEFSKEELMELGEKVYNTRCVACHQANGQGMPPAFPALAGSDIATMAEHRIEHILIVNRGKNAMPAFGAQLSPKERAAVITYERNAWGNDTGDVVQPKEIAENP